MKKSIITAAIVFFASATTAFAADIAAGEAAYMSKGCGACHGIDGNSAIAPDYPKLGGQNVIYTANQLRAFKSGERQNAIMSPMSLSLSDDDIDNISAYLASLQ